jgi:EAL domain-containing protein (putative c-di-GMP-specific phosphodiesterase class I)
MPRPVDDGDTGSPDHDVTSQLLAFVEQTPDLVGVVDEQSRVLYLNQAARKRLGVGDTTDLTTVDMFPPEAFARYYDEIRPALLRSGSWHGELPVIDGSGDVVPMAMTVVARIGPGGEVSGLVTSGREVEAADPDEFVAVEARADVSVTALTDELAVAVSQGLIQPHVKPVVDLHRGVLVGYQGLARWAHPRRGLLDAEQFIDHVANAPTLPVVDLAVLRRTAAAAARTARSGLHVRAYGHLSRRLLGDVDLTRYLTEIVDDLGIAPSALCVEIAQAFVARPSRTVERALRDLHEAGVRTVLSAVDGECDVNQIVEYGFDELRLARRLVRDARHDPARRRVAHGTIALARALGLPVTAVGIETDAERIDMRDAGCDYGQGHLFGSAQPAGSIE